MDGSDTSAGEESRGSLPGHGEVDGDLETRGANSAETSERAKGINGGTHDVALFDAPRLEDIGNLGDFPEKLSVGHLHVLSGLVRLIEDSGLGGRRVDREVSTCLETGVYAVVPDAPA